jgi:fimbrial chaperone protein
MSGAMIARVWAGFLLFTAAVNAAVAGSFAVNPVRLSLSEEHRVEAIIVRNQGSEAAVVQLETTAWTQAGGQDVYSPTREILATPPIFTVPAGGSQIVRVGLRRPFDARRELAYRLFFQEVPPPPEPGQRGLRVALRIGVPVFVPAATVASPTALRWQVAQTAPGVLQVDAVNAGNRHVRVMGLKLSPIDGPRTMSARGVSGVLLAGQGRRWSVALDEPLLKGSIRVTADTGDGEADGGVISVQAR